MEKLISTVMFCLSHPVTQIDQVIILYNIVKKGRKKKKRPAKWDKAPG